MTDSAAGEQGRPQPTLAYRADVPAPRAGTSAKPSDDLQRLGDDPAVAEHARNGIVAIVAADVLSDGLCSHCGRRWS